MASCFLVLIAAATGTRANDGAPEGVGEWESLWTRVLARHVDAAGAIDFTSLVRDHADLDRVVAFVAAVDPANRPAAFPGPNARLAYYVNAYNALAMHGVVTAGLPERLGGLRNVTFFKLRTFTVGGKSISLSNLENDVIRPTGDARIHFALNCMVVSCPRLPRAAFTAGRVDQQLDAAARAFVGEQRNVRANITRGELELSAIFRFYTQDFLAHASTLAAYVNRYRADKVPENLRVQFLDYDWTINNRRPAATR
ncbi:MAG: DUF547 domain-containing protein [Proteobacteria bacterium]|nr:DUF547 domain-containing protein [Pseudomonadota bacterium]